MLLLSLRVKRAARAAQRSRFDFILAQIIARQKLKHIETARDLGAIFVSSENSGRRARSRTDTTSLTVTGGVAMVD